MSKVSVDTSNEELLKKPVYVPIEPGIYEFEIDNDLEVTQSNAGKPMIGVKLVCIDQNEAVIGKSVTDYISMTPEARKKYDRFATLCKACGVKEDAAGEIDLEQFRGLKLRANIKQETYKKKDGSTGISNKVDEYLFNS